MAGPKNIPQNTPTEDSRPGGPAPDISDDGVKVEDFRELSTMNATVPDPPRCVLEHLKSRDLVWRWLSEPACKRLGMRMYETYSPDDRIRKLINSGKDAPAGVRVDAENRVRWMDDCFLGVIPRRYYLHRAELKRQRVKDLTKRSQDHAALREVAQRVGAKSDITVSQWVSDREDDRNSP